MREKSRNHAIKPILMIVAINVAILVGICFIFSLWLGRDYVSRETIEQLATTRAKAFCSASKQYKQAACENLKVAKIQGPQDYGPTDGSDEYSGNWFVTFYPDKANNSKQIFVVLDFAGKVQYVNETGDQEYPFCRAHSYNPYEPCPEAIN